MTGVVHAPAIGASAARAIAHAAHGYARDRRGDLVVEHVARVAATVPPAAQPLAWLHDVLEKTGVTLEDLRGQGLRAEHAEALSLLTRGDDETYELHVLRIAHAPGPAGRLARAVKLADLDDHLAHAWAPGDPPYGWARHHIAGAVARTRCATQP